MKKLSKLNFNSIQESELLSDEVLNQIEAGQDSCKSCTQSCKKGGSESYKYGNDTNIGNNNEANFGNNDEANTGTK